MNEQNTLKMTVISFVNIFSLARYNFLLFLLPIILLIVLPKLISLVNLMFYLANSSWSLLSHLEFEGDVTMLLFVSPKTLIHQTMFLKQWLNQWHPCVKGEEVKYDG